MRADQNDYNKGGMITFILSMIASLGIMIYVAFGSGGIDLKEVKPPAAAPGAPAAPAEGAAPAAPAEAPAQQPAGQGANEPWIPSNDLIARGEQLFADNCASCHGKEGKGDGPMAANLSPKPRDLIEGHWKSDGTRIGLYEVLAEGIKGTPMQSYSYMPSSDRWAMVHYVRSITKNQIADNDTDVALKAASLN